MQEVSSANTATTEDGCFSDWIKPDVIGNVDDEMLRGPLQAIESMNEPFEKHAKFLVANESDDKLFEFLVASNCSMLSGLQPVIKFISQFTHQYADEINANQYMIRTGKVCINSGKAVIILVPDDEEELFYKNIRQPRLDVDKAGSFTISEDMEAYKKVHFEYLLNEITSLGEISKGLVLGRLSWHFRTDKWRWKHLRVGVRQIRRSKTVNGKSKRYWEKGTASWCSLGWSMALAKLQELFPPEKQIMLNNKQREKAWKQTVRFVTIKKLREFGYDLRSNPTEANMCIVKEMPRTEKYLIARGRRPNWTRPQKPRKKTPVRSAAQGKRGGRKRRRTGQKKKQKETQLATKVTKDTPATSLQKKLTSFSLGNNLQQKLVSTKYGSIIGEKPEDFLFKS